jgi:polysaccharide export outer membrane protein
MHSWEASVSGTEYEVQPPDWIEISSANVPEIDGEIVTINPDGKVSLRLVGEVKVAGMTPTVIARKLESILSKYYVNPVVSVRLFDRRSKRVYVFGQVYQVGAHPYTGRDTVLSMLAQAKPTFIAWERNVKVIRPSHEENRRHVVTVDTSKITEEGKLELNFLLEEGDIVYVPPTPLGWLGLRIQELLNPILPAQQAVTAPALANNTVQNDYNGGD